MTPFDLLGALLDRCYARSKVLGFMVATLIVIISALLAACLNQDGASASVSADTPSQSPPATEPHDSQSNVDTARSRTRLDS
ncbi:conserved protein of unknown function [Burkholderia multivorans]